MKTTGIIAEYNPFHNGHKYHIEEARRTTNADYIVVVMSSDFCQRGIPAVADKYLRAEMALSNGADLVLELPVRYSTASAESFAYGAVTILNGLGVIDALCFGSECGDIGLLSEIAGILCTEPDAYRTALKEGLKNGVSFPKAREQAVLALSPRLSCKEKLSPVLSSPNNILAIEYLKALKRLGSAMIPHAILRRGAGYHDLSADGEFSSSSGIRFRLREQGMARFQVPDSVSELMNAHYERTFPVFADDFSALLHYKLLLSCDEGFSHYQDGSDALSDKIRKSLPAFSSFTTFADTLKSKEVTYSRISRLLTHILLDIKKENPGSIAKNTIDFARVLGFRESASPLLSSIKKRSAVTLPGRLSDAKNSLSPSGLEMLDETILASHIYQSVVSNKFHTEFKSEFSRQFLKL